MSERRKFLSQLGKAGVVAVPGLLASRVLRREDDDKRRQENREYWRTLDARALAERRNGYGHNRVTIYGTERRYTTVDFPCEQQAFSPWIFGPVSHGNQPIEVSGRFRYCDTYWCDECRDEGDAPSEDLGHVFIVVFAPHPTVGDEADDPTDPWLIFDEQMSPKTP